ncbi:MAG TPA: hypothetical protein VGM86_19005 [Thermoanaerobaculia bacterium]
MVKRRNLLILLVAALGFACWLTGAPAAKAGAEDCCTDLQGQACAPFESPIDCNWGAYGPGYCQCYARKWECYSYVSIPYPPDQPICY